MDGAGLWNWVLTDPAARIALHNQWRDGGRAHSEYAWVAVGRKHAQACIHTQSLTKQPASYSIVSPFVCDYQPLPHLKTRMLLCTPTHYLSFPQTHTHTQADELSEVTCYFIAIKCARSACTHKLRSIMQMVKSTRDDAIAWLCQSLCASHHFRLLRAIRRWASNPALLAAYPTPSTPMKLHSLHRFLYFAYCSWLLIMCFSL